MNIIKLITTLDSLETHSNKFTPEELVVFNKLNVMFEGHHTICISTKEIETLLAMKEKYCAN